jgi:Mrp family chromosome partitioning ATPase
VAILADAEEWHKGVRITQVDNLHLIPTSIAIPQTSIFESSAFDLLLTRFRATYDVILFTAPPVHLCTDAAVLCAKVDATCLVLTCGVSRQAASYEAKAALEAVQGKVVGAILD